MNDNSTATHQDIVPCVVCKQDFLKVDSDFRHVVELQINGYVCKTCQQQVNAMPISEHMVDGDVTL